MATDRDVDVDVAVAVVGAGPTGLVLAILLHQYGVRTLIVERNHSTYDEPRAVGISGESLRICQQLGILDRLVPELRMDVGHRYFGVDERVLTEILPQPTPDGFPAKSVFDQPQLEQLLAARAQELGIDIRFGTEATLRDQDAHGVRLALAGPGGDELIRASWVVGCDGGRSGIRKALGISLDGSTQKERWVCYDVVDDPHDEQFAELHCNGVRPVVVAPGVHGRCRYEVMLHEGEDDERFLEFATIKALLAPFRDLKQDQVRRARVYVAQQRIARHLRVARVLLSGDAYHLMPPFAGQGLNSGLRDSANLAWKLAAVVTGAADESLLDTYEVERRRHVKQMIATSVRIGKVVMVVNPTVARLRDIALRSLKIVPPLWIWVTQMRFMKPPRLIEGCVVATTTARRPPYAGMLGLPVSQYALASPDARFDDALSVGWSLLEISSAARVDVPPTITDLVHMLGATYLRLRAETSRAVHDGDIVVSDPLPPVPAGEVAVWVLVRPDRFVAAVFTAAEAEAVSKKIGTWFVDDEQERGQHAA
ncbi:FAD-dependent monooxygenase [Microbacterium luticocti]|uniref:FAD-dependent monooxygenase n=1 Tax=Microbacterium luticocti TaxID=451764 RepID=UPI0004019FC1